MAKAHEAYPRTIHHDRWCRNGAYPDSWFIRQVRDGLNHVMAYRRKVFLNAAIGFGAKFSTLRSYMRTGHGAARLMFDLAVARGDAAGDAPRVEIAVTPGSGGATQTIRVDVGGAYDPTTADAPSSVRKFYRRSVAVLPDTEYAIAIEHFSGARSLSIAGYEEAEPTVDPAVPYYVTTASSVTEPVEDQQRQTLLDGLSAVWRANGAHLLTWPGAAGPPPSFTSTSFTNIIDLTSTTVSASTPGYHFGAAADATSELATLLPLVRRKDGNDLPVRFAVYGSCTTFGFALVKFRDSAGNGIEHTSLGPTLGWYVEDATWPNVDAITGGKVDPMARVAIPGESMSVRAIAIFARST